MLPSYEMPAAHYRPVDEFMLQSDPICSSAGCTEYKLPELDPKLEWPKNYFVPDFGVDNDIEGTFESLQDAQRIRKHVWNWELNCTKDEPCNPALRTRYNFNPKLTDDIIVSQNNLVKSEKDLDVDFAEEWAPPILAAKAVKAALPVTE